MNENMTIWNIVNSMTVEEMRTRLVEYMAKDESLRPKPIGVEVRLRDDFCRSCRYAVLLIMNDGSEKEVLFKDRHSRLVYIYTLMRPKGYRRAFLMNNDLKDLRQLYSKLYFTSDEPMMKYVGDAFEQYFYQSVAQSRVAVRKAVANAPEFEIGCPKKNDGRTLIPAAANTENIIIDNTLL